MRELGDEALVRGKGDTAGASAAAARIPELNDEEIARERDFLEGIPRVNIGALFLPPIWGSAHGFWVTIIYYPAWLLADNTIYGAFITPTPLSIAIAVAAVAILAAVTVAFSIISQPFAAHRAAERGLSKEDYLRRERKWAIGCVIGGAVMIAFATYYNLVIRTEI